MMANVISWRLLISCFRASIRPCLLASALLLAPAAEGALRHEYLFNDGTANDSAPGGTADGTLTGGATVTLGQLNLNGTSAYVDLPGPTIAINTFPAITFEAWFTRAGTGGVWQRVFDFGDTGADTFGLDYVFFTPNSGAGDSRAAISNDSPGFDNEAQAIRTGGALTPNTQHHVVVTLDGTAISYYLNGALAQTTPYTMVVGANPDMLGPPSISQLSNTFAYLGRSVYPDPFFAGTINEFSIYDNAMTAPQVLQEFNQGPTGVAGPTLTINRTTGTMTFSNQQAAVQVVGYSITSAAGSLNQAAWLSIDDNYDMNQGTEFDDDEWTELSAAGSKTDFSEFEFDGGNGGAFGSGGTTSLQIGANGAWRKSPYQDLVVEMRLDDGTDVPVNIVYTGNNNMPFMRSDLNFDNAINVADWNIFLTKVGTTFTNMSIAETYAMGDLNGDLVNNRADFRLFKTDYNVANGAGAFEALIATVPEPSTLAMLVLASAGLMPWRLRQRFSLPVVDVCCGVASWRPQTRSCLALLVLAAAFFALTNRSDAAVRNRYGFNEGVAASALGRTIVDSVSGQNGIVRGTAGTGEASATATQLTLNGGASATAAYVDLPNGLVSNLTDATFEAWYTINSAQAWTRIFDFGNSEAGELNAPGGTGNGTDFLFYAPSRGTNLAQQRVGFGNQNTACGISGSTSCTGNAAAGVYTDLDTEFTHVLSQQYHAVVVIDADGGGPGIATQALYINGVLAPQAPGENQPNPLNSAHQLANLNDVNNWLGRSNWTADANFGGSFNEFRIWDNAVDESRVTNNFLLGPDANPNATVVSLEVNTVTGQVSLVSNYNQPLQIDYYEVTSAGGALNTAGWTSIDGNTAPGVGWDKSGTSNANQLIELFLPEAGYTFPAMGELTIGNAFNPAVFGSGNNGDLAFGITLATGAFLSGNVTYVGTPPMVPGDYNANGTVDAGDYVLWRNGGPLQNDPTPGVQAGDYTFWRSRFGATSGSGAGAGSSAAVPEPFAWALVGFGLLGVASLRRRVPNIVPRLTEDVPAPDIHQDTQWRRTMPGNQRMRDWSRPLIALLAVVLLATCSHAATRDRWYRFGDDTNETGPAAPGLTPRSDFGNTTLDSQSTAANASDAQDLGFSGNPVYFDAGGGALLRPGATAGQLGMQFDGNDTLFLANGGLGSPAVGDDGYNGTGAPGYTNITTRYIDGWVRPTAGAGTRRDVLNDTAQFGIFINTSNNWGFIHGATTVNSTTPAALNTWTHVYSRTFTNTAAVLYINGVAVAITEADYNTTAPTGNIVFGASLDQTSSFFTGQLDDFSIGISGDNTGQTGGMNWGAINLATENDFIRQALIGKSNADVNLDGIVNQTDINTFVANWLDTNTLGPNNRIVPDLNFRKLGDINLNGQVDIDDASLVSNAIPAGSGVSLDFSLLGASVPEPGSMILGACGWAVFALFCRRRGE